MEATQGHRCWQPALWRRDCGLCRELAVDGGPGCAWHRVTRGACPARPSDAAPHHVCASVRRRYHNKWVWFHRKSHCYNTSAPAAHNYGAACGGHNAVRHTDPSRARVGARSRPAAHSNHNPACIAQVARAGALGARRDAARGPSDSCCSFAPICGYGGPSTRGTLADS